MAGPKRCLVYFPCSCGHLLTFSAGVLVCSSLDSGEHIHLTSDLMGLSHLNPSAATSEEMYFCRAASKGYDRLVQMVWTWKRRRLYDWNPKVEAAGGVR